MTEDDFRKTCRRLLTRAPHVPVLVEIDDGNRVNIESLEQIAIRGDRVTVTHPATGQVWKFPWADVTRVVPLDELPGENGGMSFRDFYAAVRAARGRKPVPTYTVELLSGESLLVGGGNSLVLGGRYASFIAAEPGASRRFMVADVARVTIHEHAAVGV